MPSEEDYKYSPDIAFVCPGCHENIHKATALLWYKPPDQHQTYCCMKCYIKSSNEALTYGNFHKEDYPKMKSNQLEQADKQTEGKLRWDLLPFDSLEELVKVYTEGAKKYADRNWEKGMPYSKCAAALMRHWKAWWQDGERRHEKGMHHLASMAFWCFALMRYEKTRPKFDDRKWSPPTEEWQTPQVIAPPPPKFWSEDLAGKYPKPGLQKADDPIGPPTGMDSGLMAAAQQQITMQEKLPENNGKGLPDEMLPPFEELDGCLKPGTVFKYDSETKEWTKLEGDDQPKNEEPF